jgi:adenosylcobinamide-GDP ribazoletransferase
MLFRDQYREFVAALRFLSTLMLPGTAHLFDKDEIGERVIIGSAYFPVIGLLFALLLWLLILILSPVASPLVLAALVLIVEVILTGGLHLDGLMDSCDGLFGGKTRERKLEIMRDSRVGSFGVLGGVGLLILKFACFASLSVHALPFVLLMVLPTARWCMVLALHVFPSARTTGLGPLFRQAVTVQHLLIAGSIALLIAIIGGRLMGIGLWIIAAGITFALGTWITRQLGGLTGDSYGAIEEVVEVTTLVAAVFLYGKLP